MDRHHVRGPLLKAVVAAMLVGMACLGCGESARNPAAPQLSGPSSTLGHGSPATPSDQGGGSDCVPARVFDAANFTHSTTVDNGFYPLVPGTEYTLEGRADRGGGVLPHTVIFTVTDVVKVIDGVTTVVLWDRDFSENQLVEAELAFHAQDNEGNVWNLGEYPEQYENGVFTGAPSTWISGVAGAQGGIVILGNPRLGDKFLQGSVPDIQFLDCARVLKTGEFTCVPTGCYDNVLVVAERGPLEPGSGTQLKYYAPGVGNVQIGAVGDKEKETLVLVSKVRLSAQGLRQAHREALKLDQRAYSVSDVYRTTAPAH